MRESPLPSPRTHVKKPNGRRFSYVTNRKVVQRAEDALVALFPTKRDVKLLATAFQQHRQVATVFAIIQKKQTDFCRINSRGLIERFLVAREPYPIGAIQELTRLIEQFIERQLSSAIPEHKTSRLNVDTNFNQMVREQWQELTKARNPNAVVVHFGDDSNEDGRTVIRSTAYRRFSENYWQKFIGNTLKAQVRGLRYKNKYPTVFRKKVFPKKVLLTVFSDVPTSSKDFKDAVVCYYLDTRDKVRLWPPLNDCSQYVDIHEGTETRVKMQEYIMRLQRGLLTEEDLTPREQELRNFIQTILDSQDQPNLQDEPTSDEETLCASP